MSKLLRHKNLIFFLIPIILIGFVFLYMVLPIQSRLTLFGLNQEDGYILEVDDLNYQFIIKNDEIDHILIENIDVLSYTVDFRYFDNDASLVEARLTQGDDDFVCQIDIIEDLATCDSDLANYELLNELKETSSALYIIFNEHFNWDKVPQGQR